MTEETPQYTMTLDEKMTKLKEYEQRIKTERKWVDIKPYSHNIITLSLKAIHDLEIEGVSANDVISKYKLEILGWERTD